MCHPMGWLTLIACAFWLGAPTPMTTSLTVSATLHGPGPSLNTLAELARLMGFSQSKDSSHDIEPVHVQPPAGLNIPVQHTSADQFSLLQLHILPLPAASPIDLAVLLVSLLLLHTPCH